MSFSLAPPTLSSDAINGKVIPYYVHKKLLMDCEFYAEQCSEAEANNTNVLIHIHQESIKYLLCFMKSELIDDSTHKLSLFNLLELLHHLLSKELKKIAINSLVRIIGRNPAIMDGITNELYPFESEYILHLKATRPALNELFLHLKPRNRPALDNDHPQEYHFNEDLWIDIKISLFNIHIMHFFGFSYIHVGNLPTLHLMKPLNEVQRKMLAMSDKLLIAKHISCPLGSEIYQNWSSINCLHSTLTYTNGSKYTGGIRMGAFGPQRHGCGSYYLNDDEDSLEVREGGYLYDRPGQFRCCDDNIIYGKKFGYPGTAKDLRLVIKEGDFLKDEHHCEQCESAIYHQRLNNNERLLKLCGTIFGLELTSSEIADDYLYDLMYACIQEHELFGYCEEIESYDDYINAVEAVVDEYFDDPKDFEALVKKVNMTLDEYRKN